MICVLRALKGDWGGGDQPTGLARTLETVQEWQKHAERMCVSQLYPAALRKMMVWLQFKVGCIPSGPGKEPSGCSLWCLPLQALLVGRREKVTKHERATGKEDLPKGGLEIL